VTEGKRKSLKSAEEDIQRRRRRRRRRRDSVMRNCNLKKQANDCVQVYTDK